MKQRYGAAVGAAATFARSPRRLGGIALIGALALGFAPAAPAQTAEPASIEAILAEMKAQNAVLAAKVDNNFALTNAKIDAQDTKIDMLAWALGMGLTFITLLFAYTIFLFHTMNRRIDRLDEKIDRLAEKVDRLAEKMDGKLDRQNGKLDRLQEMFMQHLLGQQPQRGAAQPQATAQRQAGQPQRGVA